MGGLTIGGSWRRQLSCGSPNRRLRVSSESGAPSGLFRIGQGRLGNGDPIEGHGGGRRTTRARRVASNEAAQGGYRMWDDAYPAGELCPKGRLANLDGRTAMASDTPRSQHFRRFHGISFLGSSGRFFSATPQQLDNIHRWQGMAVLVGAEATAWRGAGDHFDHPLRAIF